MDKIMIFIVIIISGSSSTINTTTTTNKSNTSNSTTVHAYDALIAEFRKNVMISLKLKLYFIVSEVAANQSVRGRGLSE